MVLILRILVGLLMLQALLKFAVFFLVSYETRRRILDSQYGGRASATKPSDLILLGVVLVLLGLLWGSGQGDYVSFAVGLWAGMTLIQTYFHEFSKPVPTRNAVRVLRVEVAGHRLIASAPCLPFSLRSPHRFVQGSAVDSSSRLRSSPCAISSRCSSSMRRNAHA
jgi:hypothetical protein